MTTPPRVATLADILNAGPNRSREEDMAAARARIFPQGMQSGSITNPFGAMPGTPDPYAIPEPDAPKGFLARAGRMLTSALSPIQLPQDIMFATIAGAMDRDRTILDYFGDMEWANYGFWNKAPVRPVDGNRLLQLAGVKNETARQVFGLGMDFLLDPLLAGAGVRALAKAANLPDLARAANLLDTVSEAPMLLGGLPTLRVAAAARQLPGFRAIEQGVQDNLVTRYVLPVIESMNIRVGDRLFSPAGMLTVDGGRMPGAQDAMSRVMGLSDEVAENSMVLLMQADAAAGGSWWKGVLAQHQRNMSILYDVPIQEINTFTPEVSRALMASASVVTDRIGYVAGRQMGVTGAIRTGFAGAPSPSPLMQEAIGGVRKLEDELTTAWSSMRTPRDRRAINDLAQRQSMYLDERTRLMDVAQRAGDDPTKVADAFDTVVGKLQQVGALEGYFASGYGPLRERFVQNLTNHLAGTAAQNPAFARAVQRAGGEAFVINEAWRDLLRAGVRGKAKSFLDQEVSYAGRSLLGGAGDMTYRELFGEFGKIPGLDLGQYLNSLTRGHLRRSFGMFQDQHSWQKMTQEVLTGRTASTRILNEQPVYQALAGSGYRAEADIMRTYLDDIIPKVRGRPTGAFVTQQEVMSQLTRKGIAPQRAEAFWRETLKAADPYIGDLAERMAKYGKANVGNTTITQRALHTARENLGQNELETLMELMNPMLSAAETSVAVGRSLRKTEQLTSLAKLAEAQGLIHETTSRAGMTAPKWWKSIPTDQAEAMPMLAGKTVHPTVFREFSNVMMAGTSEPSRLAQLRSLITAGYLASPSTTAANVAGGFWTAALHGVNPTKLLGNMLEVYRDWRKLGRKLPELAHMRDIVQNGVSQSDLIRHADEIGVGAMGLRDGVHGLGRALHDASQKYQQFLRRPLGSRASGILGLGAFEASESLFRMATFRMVMKETGGNVDEARKMARFLVFDYSAQPGAVQVARNTGVMLFPAFPYFMVGRTLNAARSRPGLLAVAERVPEIVSKMVVPDEEQRKAMLMGMEDWMMDDKYIPIRRQKNGDITMLSFNQLIPTNTMTGAPFGDALKSAGLWGPLIDVVSAISGLGGQDNTDPGRGRFTGPFGRRVLPSGTESFAEDPGSVLSGVTSFLYNSFAPAMARKLVRPPEEIDRTWEGLVPKLAETAMPVSAEWAESGRTARELSSGRVDQDLLDAAVSFGVRSTRGVATEGLLSTGPRILERATRALDSQLARLDRRIQLLAAEGKQPQVNEAMKVRDRLVQRYMNRWGDYIAEIRQMASVGRFAPPPTGR
jgi:hypothetical protein